MVERKLPVTDSARQVISSVGARVFTTVEDAVGAMAAIVGPSIDLAPLFPINPCALSASRTGSRCRIASGIEQRHGRRCYRKARCDCPWRAEVYSPQMG